MRTAILSLTLVAAAGTIVRSTAGQVPNSPEAEAALRAAIIAAVQDRLGASADVTVEHVWVPPITSPVASITAVLEPGARLGRPVQFRIRTAGGPAGDVVRFSSAVASLSVRIEHARLVSAVRPGTTLTPDMTVSVVDRVAGEVRLERLPTVNDLAGARSRALLQAGVVIEEWMIERAAVVRSGETVGVRAVVGGVEARGVARASERGVIGSIIRLVNLQSGRAIKGRVVGKGEVEVVP